MIDNSKKLDELESKMNILEATLAEIKAAIKEKRGS
jgi:BMFP domain-containing protein YqiC